MKTQNTRRGITQEVENKNCHSKFNLESHHVLLSKVRSRIKYGMTSLFNNNQEAGDPRQRHAGMTPLFGNGGFVESAEQKPLSIRPLNKKAFTLIELLVVVLIIGILAAVAVPQYQKAVVKSKFAILQVNVTTLLESVQRYYLEYGELPPQGDLNNVDISNLSGCEPNASGDLICSDSYYHWENTPWFGRYVEGFSIKGGNINNKIIGYRRKLSKTAMPEDKICFSDSTGSVCKSMGTPHPANMTMYELP